MSAIVNKSGSPKAAWVPTLLEHRVMESRQGKPLRGCRFVEIGFQPGCALHQGLWHSLGPTEHLRTSWSLCGAAERMRSLVTTCVKSIPTAANGEGCQPLPTKCLCQTYRELQITEMATEGCWAGRHSSSHAWCSIPRFIKCRESPNHACRASACTVSGHGNQQTDTQEHLVSAVSIIR